MSWYVAYTAKSQVEAITYVQRHQQKCGSSFPLRDVETVVNRIACVSAIPKNHILYIVASGHSGDNNANIDVKVSVLPYADE